MTDKLLLVSADSHTGAAPEACVDRFEPQYRGRITDLGETRWSANNLDRAKLLDVAARIGPSVADVLDTAQAVTLELLADFRKHAGYSSPQEQVDTSYLSDRFKADVGALVGA